MAAKYGRDDGAAAAIAQGKKTAAATIRLLLPRALTRYPRDASSTGLVTTAERLSRLLEMVADSEPDALVADGIHLGSN